MKLFSLIILISVMQSFTTLHAQHEKVLLSGSKMTFIELIKKIEEQTSYQFVYQNEHVKDVRIENVNYKQESVEDVLKDVFKKTELTYRLLGNNIIIMPDDEKPEEKPFTVVQAEVETIKGNVIDVKTKETLIGVNIMVKGTTIGVITDFDGNFELNYSGSEKVLLISYIGYTSIEVTWEPNKELSIQLSPSTEDLDEVVVVGYGVVTKRSMIAAVSTIAADDMALLPTANLSQSLAGRAAGLIVQGSGGGINKKSTISIRGGGTPLVVIDGIIRNYDDFLQLTPDDIEAFSILKDASATAVYGSRASDGIIQITTKKGKLGTPSVEYGFSYSIAEPATWPRTMNSWDRAYYANIGKNNEGLDDAFSAENIQKMKDGSDPISYSNTNWRDMVLRQFAPLQKHSLRFTGGNERSQYYASLNYIDQESLYKSNNHNMQRTNFRLSTTSNIDDIDLKVIASIDGYLEKDTHPFTSAISGTAGVFQMIQNRSPFAPAKNKHGLAYNATGNVYAELFGDVGYINNNKNVVNGNLSLEWSLPWVEGLKFKGTGNYRLSNSENKQWRKDPAKYDWDMDSNPLYDGKPQLYHRTNSGYTYTVQFFASYDKTFGKHSVSALAGHEATYGFSKEYWVSRDNYEYSIDQISVGPESTQKNGGSEGESGRAGFIGQLKYNYNHKYFVEASIRYDGSDNFPEDRRWGTFYSTSLGWSVIDENFMQTISEKNIFNQLKVRASYGQVGLDNWGDENNPFHIGRFEYINSYSLNNKAWILNGAYVSGFSEGAIPSTEISWFTTDQFDIGFDFASLNNRLYGSFDYFFYKTKGFLYAPNPIDVGYTDPIGTGLPRISTEGEHRRAGIDLSLGWKNNVGELSYDISGNFTKFDQLWALKPDEGIADVQNPYKRASQQVGYYGNLYKSLGFYEGTDDVYNSVKRQGSSNLTSGDLKYEDFNGDGKIDGADQIRSGKNSFPRGNYGINIKLDYKGWFLSTLFQGATRFDMYLSNAQAAQTAELPIIYDYQTDFWTAQNTDAKYPRLVSDGYNGDNNYVDSDFWLINGAYLRMKDITIGHNFKHTLAKNIKWLSTATVAISGQNLFTISEATKYGLDPENSSVEHGGYPNERIYSISINLGFKK